MKAFILVVAFGFLQALIAGESGKLTVTWLVMPVHGLAAVVETPSGKAFLVDTGGTRAAPEYNAGRDTIAPFLKSRGHGEIHGIVISHPHGDHFGGAEWLLNHWKVREFVDHAYEGRGQSLAYTRLRGLAVERGGAHHPVHAGDKLDWDDGLSVEVLSPPGAFLDPNSDPAKVSEHGLLNSNSIVLRVQHGKNVFIFPGDAYGGTFEKHLKTLPPDSLKATVLTSPHHGFNPGTDFPKMALPKYVVASCVADYPANAGTPYPRSPGDNAIKVFGALGADVFVTAFHGNITAVSDGESVTMAKAHERTPQSATPGP
jgi:competence protein ComEC